MRRKTKTTTMMTMRRWVVKEDEDDE